MSLVRSLRPKSGVFPYVVLVILFSFPTCTAQEGCGVDAGLSEPPQLVCLPGRAVVAHTRLCVRGILRIGGHIYRGVPPPAKYTGSPNTIVFWNPDASVVPGWAPQGFDAYFIDGDLIVESAGFFIERPHHVFVNSLIARNFVALGYLRVQSSPEGRGWYRQGAAQGLPNCQASFLQLIVSGDVYLVNESVQGFMGLMDQT